MHAPIIRTALRIILATSTWAFIVFHIHTYQARPVLAGSPLVRMLALLSRAARRPLSWEAHPQNTQVLHQSTLPPLSCGEIANTASLLSTILQGRILSVARLLGRVRHRGSGHLLENSTRVPRAHRSFLPPASPMILLELTPLPPPPWFGKSESPTSSHMLVAAGILLLPASLDLYDMFLLLLACLCRGRTYLTNLL